MPPHRPRVGKGSLTVGLMHACGHTSCDLVCTLTHIVNKRVQREGGRASPLSSSLLLSPSATSFPSPPYSPLRSRGRTSPASKASTPATPVAAAEEEEEAAGPSPLRRLCDGLREGETGVTATQAALSSLLLICEDASNIDAVLACRGVAAVYACLRSWPGHCDIVTLCLSVLAALTGDFSPPRTAPIITAEVSDEERAWACKRYLAASRGVNPVGDLVASTGGLPLVAAALAAFPSSPSLQHAGMRVITHCAADSAHRVVVCAGPILAALLAAMDGHPSSEEIQALGCTCLRYLFEDPECVNVCAASECVERVYNALGSHPGSPSLQLLALSACLALAQYPTLLPGLCLSDGVGLVASAMNAHLVPPDEPLVHTACVLLSFLTRCTAGLLMFGAVEDVFRVMDVVSDSPRVQAACIATLANLCVWRDVDASGPLMRIACVGLARVEAAVLRHAHTLDVVSHAADLCQLMLRHPQRDAFIGGEVRKSLKHIAACTAGLLG